MNRLGNLVEPTSIGLLRLTEAEDRLRAAAERAGAEMVVLGESRGGRPIAMARFGRAAARSFWYAGPHANEAVGVSTIVQLAERLAVAPDVLGDEVGFDLVLCVDPDGHVLNEPWFGPDIDPARYFRGFFRPAMDEFPDWDFPLDHTSAAGSLHREPRLPESAALRAGLELSRPIALNALHNAELGGAHFCLVGDPPGLAEELSTLPPAFAIPRESAMLDDPSAVPLAPGVFPMPDLAAACEAVLASGHPDPVTLLPFGDSAASWCRRYNTVAMVPEIPYWSVVEQAPPDGVTAGEISARTAEALARASEWFDSVLAESSNHLPDSDPRVRSVRDCVGVLARVAAGLSAWADTGDARSAATFEEVARMEHMLGSCLPQRYRGMLLTALEAHDGPPSVIAAARDAFDRGQEKIDALQLQAHPVRRLVEMQLRAGMAVTASALAR